MRQVGENVSIQSNQPKRKNWWQRLWSPELTLDHAGFDFVVGVFLPLLCLWFDPVVFRSGGACVGTVLGDYAPFAYTAIGLGMLTLTTWLIANRWITKVRAFFAGIFVTGFLFALLIGVVLIPWSLLGLIIYCLGALGLFPFVTAMVYWRNAKIAWREASEPTWLRIALLILGAVAVVGIASFVQSFALTIMPWAIVGPIPSCSTQ
jgi:hypothetical protein